MHCGLRGNRLRGLKLCVNQRLIHLIKNVIKLKLRSNLQWIILLVRTDIMILLIIMV